MCVCVSVCVSVCPAAAGTHHCKAPVVGDGGCALLHPDHQRGMYVCTCVCMYVCMCVCMYVCMYAHIHIHTYIDI